MGTRGVWGFIVDGQKKMAYNHWDSYPSGLGRDLAQDLADYPGTLDELKEEVRKIKMVSEDVEPTEEEIEKLLQHADLGVSTKSPKEWYVLLRDLQGKLALTVEAGYMIEGFEFGYDGLFCEWGYVIDLDAAKFVVYGGGWTERTENHGDGIWFEASGDEKGIRPCAAAYDLEDALIGQLGDQMDKLEAYLGGDDA